MEGFLRCDVLVLTIASIMPYDTASSGVMKKSRSQSSCTPHEPKPSPPTPHKQTDSPDPSPVIHSI
jgi:hypothetical protein